MNIKPLKLVKQVLFLASEEEFIYIKTLASKENKKVSELFREMISEKMKQKSLLELQEEEQGDLFKEKFIHN